MTTSQVVFMMPLSMSLVKSPSFGFRQRLRCYATVIQRDLQKEVDRIPGSGAAGGMGAGLLTFLDGELKSGFDIVSSKLDLEKIAANVDLVITAEGKIDQQTKFGKAPYGMAMIAKKYQKPVFAFAGQLGAEKEVLLELGFTDVFPISDGQMPLEESIRRAPELLEKSAAEAYDKFLKSRT